MFHLFFLFNVVAACLSWLVAAGLGGIVGLVLVLWGPLFLFSNLDIIPKVTIAGTPVWHLCIAPCTAPLLDTH